jgi:hypothetical protein
MEYQQFCLREQDLVVKTYKLSLSAIIDNLICKRLTENIDSSLEK